MNFKDKVVIVTGGTRGIGLEVAKSFYEKEANVIIFGSKKESVDKTVEELSKDNILVEGYYPNLNNYQEVVETIDKIYNKYKKIDVLINNAGIDQFKLFTDITEQDWNDIINTNLKGPVFLTKRIAQNMIKNKKGCIINISSIWGVTGASCEVLYSISKAGMDGFTKSLAKELALSNIRVNSIAPGAIDTDMNKNIIKDEIIKEIPLRKIGDTREYSKMCTMAY